MEQVNSNNKDSEGRISLLDSSLRSELRSRGLYYVRLMGISTVMLWAAMSIFYGAVFRRSTYIYRTQLELVDLDHGPVGAGIVQAALAAIAESQSVASANVDGWRTQPTWRQRRDFATIGSVRSWVRRHGWGALVINSGASARLADALLAANSSSGYRAADAVTLLLNTGRHPIIELTYLQPALTGVGSAAITKFSTQLLGTLNLQTARLTPALVAQPVGLTVSSVAPMTFSIAPVVYLFGFLTGLLCVVGPLIAWKLTTAAFFERTKHRHVWLGAVALIMGWATYIALLGALAQAAFRGPAYSAQALAYTVGRFFSVWMTEAMVLTTTGLWLANWFLLLTPELQGLASLMTVLPNIVSTLVPTQTAPRFYRWMYAGSFYNGAMLYRYVLSGAYPQIGLNVGVVLGEMAALAAVLYATTWVRQYVLVAGLSDVPGWYRGSKFFAGKKKNEPAEGSVRRSLWSTPGTIDDSDNDAVSLQNGDLGV